MKMSGFYSKEELEAMHFKSLGKNVSISRKASLYHTEEMEIGNNVRIEDFCVLNGNITIGNNVMICVFCLLDGNCGIVIEDNVTIAARVIKENKNNEKIITFGWIKIFSSDY